MIMLAGVLLFIAVDVLITVLLCRAYYRDGHAKGWEEGAAAVLNKALSNMQKHGVPTGTKDHGPACEYKCAWPKAPSPKAQAAALNTIRGYRPAVLHPVSCQCTACRVMHHRSDCTCEICQDYRKGSGNC